jgi:hypothetical protein
LTSFLFTFLSLCVLSCPSLLISSSSILISHVFLNFSLSASAPTPNYKPIRASGTTPHRHFVAIWRFSRRKDQRKHIQKYAGKDVSTGLNRTRHNRFCS